MALDLSLRVRSEFKRSLRNRLVAFVLTPSRIPAVISLLCQDIQEAIERGMAPKQSKEHQLTRSIGPKTLLTDHKMASA